MMKYQNPIIRGFHPDPSVCRAGERYYLVNSSFEYFPGIPVFESVDLLNWEQIGNCLTESDSFPLENVEDSGGVWAPTIRYEEGIFYVTATLEKYGNFIVTATDPRGPWSAPVWVQMGGIDPSLYFEEGKAYYCTNESLHPGREEISMAQICPQTGEVIGEKKTLWCGMGGGFLEAPHVYRIGAYYYLMAAEGGTNFNHMATMARGRELWGPYEGCPGNPILTNVHDTSKEVQCVGHGDLVQDTDGNWWMAHLATRVARRTMSHLGRETFLTPVVWEDGWPKTLHERKAVLEEEGPAQNCDAEFRDQGTPSCCSKALSGHKESLYSSQKRDISWCPDFRRKDWEPEWIFLRNPQRNSYERGNGLLKIIPSRVKLSEGKNPSFVAVRQPDFDCRMAAAFCFDSRMVGDEAGLAILLSSAFYYLFVKRKTEAGEYLILERHVEDIHQIAWQIPIGEGQLFLCVAADRLRYTFSYSKDGQSFQEAASLSARFLSCEVAGRCFTGTVMGFYAGCREETEAVMEVRKVEVIR